MLLFCDCDSKEVCSAFASVCDCASTEGGATEGLPDIDRDLAVRMLVAVG